MCRRPAGQQGTGQDLSTGGEVPVQLLATRGASMKLRVRFQKLGKVRWISHRDIARCVERAVRRAKLPVAYSEGFSPRPRISFGLALPTGAESLAEYLDIDFAASEVDVDTVGSALSAGLPVGIDVTATAPLAVGAASLQEAVVASRWEIGVFGDPMPEGWFDAAATRFDRGLRAGRHP